MRGLRKMENEELHDIYSSPNIIRMTMSMRIRRPGGIVCIEEEFTEGFGR
jgi:hypothetical protein